MCLVGARLLIQARSVYLCKVGECQDPQEGEVGARGLLRDPSRMMLCPGAGGRQWFCSQSRSGVDVKIKQVWEGRAHL